MAAPSTGDCLTAQGTGNICLHTHTCFQLAAGGPIDDIIGGFQSQISAIVGQGQAQATAIQQNIQSSAQNAASNAVSQFQDSLSSFQKNVSDQFSGVKEAQSKIQACLQNQSEAYNKILNSTSK
jgi:hypothetical protein